jgi:hypothetical protein
MKKFLQITCAAIFVIILSGCSNKNIHVDEETLVAHSVSVISSISDDTKLLVELGREEAGATIEIQRNGPRFNGFIGDADIDSPYEYDMLLSDRYDNVIISYAGANRLVDRDWVERVNRPVISYNVDDRREDLRIIVDWVAESGQGGTDFTAFRWEIQDAQHVAQTVLDEFDVNDIVSSPTPR